MGVPLIIAVGRTIRPITVRMHEKNIYVYFPTKIFPLTTVCLYHLCPLTFIKPWCFVIKLIGDMIWSHGLTLNTHVWSFLVHHFCIISFLA